MLGYATRWQRETTSGSYNFKIRHICRLLLLRRSTVNAWFGRSEVIFTYLCDKWDVWLWCTETSETLKRKIKRVCGADVYVYLPHNISPFRVLNLIEKSPKPIAFGYCRLWLCAAYITQWFSGYWPYYNMDFVAPFINVLCNRCTDWRERSY